MTQLAQAPFATGFGFAEAPRWRDGHLWVADMALNEIVCLDESGQVVERLSTPDRPGGLGWLPSGELLVVMMTAKRLLRRSGTEWLVHAEIGDLVTEDLNDMVVSRDGNAYVTGHGYVYGLQERRPTRIVLVRPDGTTSVQEGDVWLPNGCVITPDQRRFIVAEFSLHRLTQFAISADGTLEEPHVLGVLPKGSLADGICLDEAGGVWVADPRGSRCMRVDADGQVDKIIDTPAPCIACTLGGSDGRTLFLLLSDTDGGFEVFRERRQAHIVQVRVETPGAGSP